MLLCFIACNVLRLLQVQDGNLTKQYLQLLPPAEQQYVSEAASAEIQKERLLARTLQRTVLARYLASGVIKAYCCDTSDHINVTLENLE